MSLHDLPITMDEAKEHTYQYWTSNKPIPSFDNHSFGKMGAINNDFGKDNIYSSLEPISFDPLTWNVVKIDNNDNDNDSDIEKIVMFINKYNYINETERFIKIITPSYLKWALGINGVCHVLKYKNTIVCVVCIAFPTVIIRKENVECVNIKYLCVHPHYRNINTSNKSNKSNTSDTSDTSDTSNKSNNIIHGIFDEIIRYYYNKEFRHGIFTTEVFVPTPFVSYREYFRPLNYEKLLNSRFFVLNGDKKSIQERFNENTKPSDIYSIVYDNDDNIDNIMNSIYDLYNEYCSKFHLCINYTFEEFKLTLLNENVRLFIIRNKNNIIVDFVSYYKYEMAVKDNNENIKCARMFLYTCLCEEITVLGSNTIRLIIKYDNDIDVFWSNNLNQSKDYILCDTLRPDEDSDEEECKKAYELKFSKYSCVKYINAFNYKTGILYPYQVLFPDQ